MFVKRQGSYLAVAVAQTKFKRSVSCGFPQLKGVIPCKSGEESSVVLEHTFLYMSLFVYQKMGSGGLVWGPLESAVHLYLL